MEHTFDVAIKGVKGLPSAARLLDVGLHAPSRRYLRYHFPGEAGLTWNQSQRVDAVTVHRFVLGGILTRDGCCLHEPLISRLVLTEYARHNRAVTMPVHNADVAASMTLHDQQLLPTTANGRFVDRCLHWVLVGEPTALSSEQAPPEAIADLCAEASHTIVLPAEAQLEASAGSPTAHQILTFEVRHCTQACVHGAKT